MTAPLQLLIYTEEVERAAYAAVAARFPQIETHLETSPERFVQVVQRTDLACMARKYERAWFLDAPRLKWLHVGGTGIDRLHPLDELNPDLVISNTPGLNAEMMADYVICTLLMLTWNFPRLWRNQMAAKWERWGVERVQGKMLVLIGLGNIGRSIVRRAGALGLVVTGVTRSGTPVPKVERVVGPDQLHQVLGEADYVVLAVPLTNDTRRLIGSREFDAMKPSAYLINVSRGSVVQEQALITSLKEERIAGAALDVFECEPLPPDSPLWKLENVILTPHLSSWSNDYRIRSAEMFGINLERYLSGQPLLHVVNRAKGY